ncbi:11901_t:CDS:2, partial [Dentiscutata heterogama]
KRDHEALYKETICRKCLKESETFEHLTAYSADLKLWSTEEATKVQKIWSFLEKNEQDKIEKLYLQGKLLGSHP